MTVSFTKLNHVTHRSDPTRQDGSAASVVLDTKTYFLHDACHYFVEQALRYPDEFWGLLARGYSFDALSDKANAQTDGLRLIEKIVGPVQSVVSGNLSPEAFAPAVAYLQTALLNDFDLTHVTGAVQDFRQRWERLPFEDSLTVTFDVPAA